MKVVKTASGNQIKMSKSEWESIGKTAGWATNEDFPNAGKKCPRCDAIMKRHNIKEKADKGYKNCPNCNITYSPESQTKQASNDSNSPVSIFDFAADWENEGYGLALISYDDIVIDPYVDPSDYPEIMLSKSGNGAKVIEGKYKGYYIIFHSGQLENMVGKDWVETKTPLKPEAKKKSPKEHGFIEECIEDNKDKDDPGAYCASIVDKVKGTTEWRGEKKKEKKSFNIKQYFKKANIEEIDEDEIDEDEIDRMIIEDKEEMNRALGHIKEAYFLLLNSSSPLDYQPQIQGLKDIYNSIYHYTQQSGFGHGGEFYEHLDERIPEILS